MVADLIVDVRGLDPPEPMERVLGALAELQREQRLLFRIHREPFPLYRILRNNGYQWQTRVLDDGTFEITIWEPSG